MSEEKKFVPALGYDWLTIFYDATIKLTMPEKRFRNKLMDFVSPQKGESILEFGFGTGQNLILAHGRNPEAQFSALDIDPKVREIARHKLKKNSIDITLDLYDGKTFPYADETFTKVFSSLVFHQLSRETKVSSLREIYRVLKSGGQLIIGDWGQAKSNRMRMMFYLVQIIDGFETTRDNVQGLMPEFIRQAGFSGTEEVGFLNAMIGSYSYYRAIK